MAAAPPLRDRGHRTGGGEARAAAAASSRADFHRAEDGGKGGCGQAKLLRNRLPASQEGVQGGVTKGESQRVRFVLLLSEN